MSTRSQRILALSALTLGAGLCVSWPAMAAPPEEDAAPTDAAPAAGAAAPGDDAGPPEADAPGTDPTPVELEPAPAPSPVDGEVSAQPSAQPSDDPVTDASGEGTAQDGAADSDVVEAEGEPHVEMRKLANVQLPAIGNTQPWIRYTAFLDYFGDNYNTSQTDDTFIAFVNYANFGTETRFEKWTLSTAARVDTANVFNTSGVAFCDANGDGTITNIEQENCNFGDTYRLERFMIRADFRKAKVTLGDFNVNFGRGVGLSVRKIADIGVDATIKGARVDIRTKPVQLTGIAGMANRQQSDYATRRLLTDPGYPHFACTDAGRFLNGDPYGNPLWSLCSDVITGGRIDTKLPGKVQLGSHYTFFWFGQERAGQYEGLHSVGGDIGRANIGKVWTVFVGGTGLMRNYHLKEEQPALAEEGGAVYLQNLFNFGNTNIVLEGKYYDNYVVAKDVGPLSVQYAEAPTLEREDQQIPAAANTAGGRLLVEYTFPQIGLTIFGNYLAYAFALNNATPMFGDSDSEMVHHGYAGLRWRDIERGATIQAWGGYRWEGFQSTPDGLDSAFTRKLPDAFLYYTQLIGNAGGFAHSINFRGDWRMERLQKAALDNLFHRGNLIFGYGMAPYLNLSFIGGFSTEFAAPEDGVSLQSKPCEGGTCLRKPHLWPGAEIRYNFISSSFIRIFGGRQVGGLLCVNGSCRVLPDFEGVRLDLVMGF